ncbi:MAG: hypothetical protein LBM68_07105 [Bacteroidales bacterium]|jgi:hypothetical protein|nr:hypothetical protein [Bacteroidales bacterium]
MANRRQFKKEISLILDLVIEECVFTCECNEKNCAQVEELINDAITEFDAAYVARKEDTNVSYKAFYTAIKETYYQKMLNILEKLTALRKA